MSEDLFDKTCTEALGEYWSDYTRESEDKLLKKLYVHMQKRITELEDLILNAGPLYWVAHHDMDGAKAWEKRAAELIPLLISEGGGVCQNCMGEGIDLIQSGRMVIKEKCTSCNGTGRSEGGADV